MRNTGTTVSQPFTTIRSREDIVFFDAFRFDRAQQRLWRGSEEIALRPKALALLHELLQRPGQLVTKQELLDAVWPDTSVTDAVLKVCISEIRRALGDGRAGKRLIETRHRRGYRLISAPVSRPPERATFGAPDSPVRMLNREAADGKSITRLVGRDPQLAALRDHLALAIRGERQTMFVTGELGVGKTSVVDAWLEQVSDRHELLVIRSQCAEHRDPAEPFQPILEALSRLCREPGEDRLIELLTAHAPAWVAQMSWSAAQSAPRVSPADEPAVQARMIREMVDTLERIAAESPIAFIVEDLHWADGATLALLVSLARPRTPAALFVVGTCVPFVTLDADHRLKAVKQDLQVHKRCVELPLPPLSAAQVLSWMEARFPGAHSIAELATAVHEQTEGNPLFVSSVVEGLVGAGVLVRRDKLWELTTPPSSLQITVPDPIHQALDLQFERLTPDQQQILEAASVAGVEFTAAAVGAALEQDALPIEEWCETLVRRDQYLQSAGIARKADGRVTARFRFAHVFYQRVLYQRILPRMRMRWHLRIDAYDATLGLRPASGPPRTRSKTPRLRR